MNLGGTFKLAWSDLVLALRQAFYRFPKLVYHIDEGAVAALTRYYDAAVPDLPC